MTETVNVSDGTHIAYAEVGDEHAPPLVLVHSLGCDHHMWDPQIEDFAQTHRVIAIDIRGHGASDAPDDDYTLDRLGLDVIDLVDWLGVDGFDYCGLSVGGLVGQWLGLNAGTRLRSLTLCNTGAKISERARWDERIEIARSEGMGPLVDAVIERWFKPEYVAAHPDEIDDARTTLHSTDPLGYAGCCAAIRGADLRADVHAIVTRTLIVAGTSDIATPPELSTFLNDEIKGSELVLLDAGHLSNVEQPAAFLDAVTRFLA
ncbi:MAG TPA: 3-oxoadipate enol-lactonase [Acidimicrobiales bacterium]|nr:3-oxoadipate enol-lactonase [Acidimicrobiales bacterium]